MGLSLGTARTLANLHPILTKTGVSQYVNVAKSFVVHAIHFISPLNNVIN